MEKLKIPKSLDSYIQKNLGIGLKELLGKKKVQVLKKDLKAIVCLLAVNRDSVQARIVLLKGTQIIIDGPTKLGFKEIEHNNKIKFKLKSLKFTRVKHTEYEQSYFFTGVKDLVKALK